MRPGIDLVVVNYRSPGDLTRFVESLATQAAVADQATLTIVNVAPERADREAAKLAADRAVTSDWVAAASTVEHEVNVGYNRACNDAGSLGDREVVVCCNADVQFLPASPVLANLHYGLTANTEWGIAGPRQTDHQGRITAAGIFGGLAKPKHRGFHDRRSGAFNDLRTDATLVSGAIFALRRNVWVELAGCPRFQQIAPDERGPFLPTTHYWGESYACAHAHGHGFKCVYDGRVTAIHELHGAPGSTAFGRRHMDADQTLFRAACAAHGLAHD